MSCEHLICAQCAGPVIEGRCPSCRAAREKIHRHWFLQGYSFLIIAAAVLLFFALLALQHLNGGS
ncbi:MAG TPA: hypothetical protein VIR33_03060 [Thermopolyspora sp.]|jgi:hypothetical protein